MGLAERLADLGEIEEGTHGSRLDSPARAQRNSFFHQPSRRRSDVAAGCGKRRCLLFQVSCVTIATESARGRRRRSAAANIIPPPARARRRRGRRCRRSAPARPAAAPSRSAP